jgi:hypothetical protein
VATHVFQNLTNTIYATFEVDGTPTTAGTVTVTITRDSDGTTLVSGGSTTTGDTGVYKYSLTPTQTATLDLLTVTWTGTSVSGITVTTQVEVVGAPLFSITEARQRVDLSDTAKYSDAQIAAVRQAATEAIEEVCNGVKFTPRYGTYTTDADNTGVVKLPHRKISRITAATNDGTAYSSTDIAAFKIYPGGTLKRRTPIFWTNFRQLTFKYEHGYTICPEQIKRAAIDLTEYWLIETAHSNRATSVSDGTASYSLATAGIRGFMFDLPSVQAAVNQYAWGNMGSVL